MEELEVSPSPSPESTPTVEPVPVSPDPEQSVDNDYMEMVDKLEEFRVDVNTSNQTIISNQGILNDRVNLFFIVFILIFVIKYIEKMFWGLDK